MLFTTLNSTAQSKIHQFFELSTPEQGWVIFHIFKANKAFEITKESLKVTDSISNLDRLVNDINGGQTDAFKHSYWMARLTQEIGQNAAIKLGEAHEKGNYKTFKRNKLEDGIVPDAISSEMDLFNNNVGAKIAVINKGLDKETIIFLIIESIENGEMRILKKDRSGNFLTCSGKKISKEQLKGQWENEKCLVNSNFLSE